MFYYQRGIQEKQCDTGKRRTKNISLDTEGENKTNLEGYSRFYGVAGVQF